MGLQQLACDDDRHHDDAVAPQPTPGFQLSPSPSPPSARATCRSSTVGHQPPPTRAHASRSRSNRQMRRAGIRHSNLCATCSRYVHVFRHRCLVCGRAYCHRCVGVDMGNMTEGRKCLDCLGCKYIHRARATAAAGLLCLCCCALHAWGVGLFFLRQVTGAVVGREGPRAAPKAVLVFLHNLHLRLLQHRSRREILRVHEHGVVPFLCSPSSSCSRLDREPRLVTRRDSPLAPGGDGKKNTTMTARGISIGAWSNRTTGMDKRRRAANWEERGMFGLFQQPPRDGAQEAYALPGPGRLPRRRQVPRRGTAVRCPGRRPPPRPRLAAEHSYRSFYVPPLASLPCAATTLRVLELDSCGLEPSAQAQLALPRLTDLTLRNCTYLQGYLQVMVDAAPALTTLSLVDVTNKPPKPVSSDRYYAPKAFNLPLCLLSPMVTALVLETCVCQEELDDSRNIGIQLDMPSLRSFCYKGFPSKLSLTSPAPGLARVHLDTTHCERGFYKYEPTARALASFSSTRALKLHLTTIDSVLSHHNRSSYRYQDSIGNPDEEAILPT
ncbi:hypothetical protein ZWY2020_009992 [Hordeum vulgare]|nr:hypothetical protein ZWY2020_009992 [Hordeum vulgare]